MKLAIMQPYFLPYIGYYQLIAAVDQFIIYDNIKYTKKGWINRNRMLMNDKDLMFSLPLKSDSDYLHVCERKLAVNFDRKSLLKQFEEAYRRAPYFEQIYPLLKQIIMFDDTNLFRFIHYSVIKICEYLGITTKIKISSEIDIDHNLKSQDKVIALCKAIDANIYVNAIGGIELYSKEKFQESSIELEFIKSKLLEYHQFGDEFVPWLSIIDVMMFNSLNVVKSLVTTNYELI